LASLTFEHIQQREARWLIVDLLGKGQKLRSVPMPAGVKLMVDLWGAAAGFSNGRIFRHVNKGGRVVGASLTPEGVFGAVRQYTRMSIEGARIAPHDLRRTFAKLAHQGKAPLEQIQLSLGHASIQTTERYLGIQQDLQDAPCDHLQINWTVT